MKAELFLVASLLAAGQGQALANSGLNSEVSLTLWSAGSYRSPVNSDVNPDNVVLHMPQWLGTVEARPDLQLTWGKTIVVARPKLVFSADHVTSGGGDTARTSPTAEVNWTEAFVSYPPTEMLSITYGLQNFQWGPAESASPSNRIFRDTIQAKDALYDVEGRHLLRLNLTPERDWTEVFMLELPGRGEPEFEAGAEFAHQALVKSDYAWNGGADYAGLVTGWRAGAGFWLGEYLNIGLTDGLTAYFDASHQQGSLAWYPQESFAQSRKSESRIYTFSVVGLRYVFVNGDDLRVEWVFQEAGYTSDEVADAWSILRTSPQSLVYARQSGLDFPGRQYAFASLRVPDVFHTKDWIAYVRCLVSLQDVSVATYWSSEAAVGRAGTVFVGFLFTGGSEDSELRGLVGTAITIGYRHTW